MAFDTIPPKSTLKPQPFKAETSEQDLADFKQLLKLSKLGPKTYENLQQDRFFGISRDWLGAAKTHWQTSYDWQKCLDRINTFPNYTVQIEDIDVHFLALFSKKIDAVPLALLHGWPGSFLEFMSVCELLKKKYGEDDLPYHIIVPSLPGYGYSSGPPLDRNWQTEDIARVIDKLMVGLGFGKENGGYVPQGGDIGSFVTRVLGGTSEHVRAAHLNFAIGLEKPNDQTYESLTAQEQKGLERMADFGLMGNAYSKEHGTRPATIGLTLSSSPIALLAWIGEKFLMWSDTDPPLDEILDSVTLYWFTNSFPRAIFPYRQFFGKQPTSFHGDPELYINKPLGYSYFPMELAPVPSSWISQTGNLVFSKVHDEGGHFAAMEKPKLFLEDIEEFIKQHVVKK